MAQGLSPEQMQQLGQMIVQVNEGMSQVGQVLEKISPDAAQALGEVQQGYQQAMGSVMQQLKGGQEGREPAPEQRDANAGAAQTRPAY